LTIYQHDHVSLPAPLAQAINRFTLACWPSAFIVFMLHVSNTAFTTSRAFDQTACWLIAAGCCGCPAFALRALGRLTTPRTCITVAAFAFGAALLFTGLDMVGYIGPTPSNRLIALVLMLAIAIQSINAADLTYARGRQEARHAAEVTRLNQEWSQAVARARTNHLESCCINAAQQTRQLAELIDEASGLTDAQARVLERALRDRTKIRGANEPTDPQLKIVTFEKANWDTRN
jgi:hypothetical protein